MKIKRTKIRMATTKRKMGMRKKRDQAWKT